MFLCSKVRAVCTVIFFLVLTTGCSSINNALNSAVVASLDLKEPTAEYKSFNIRSVTAKKIALDVILEANNPNNVGLKNLFVDLDVSIEGKRLLKSVNSEIALNASGKSDIRLPIEIVYEELFNSAGAIAGNILRNDSSIPVQLKYRLHGKPTMKDHPISLIPLSVDQESEKTISIPLPEDKVGVIKDLLGKHLNL
ncbi:LEA type 2 family protein [Veronia pacifica]|uniref:Late embryogenesis abundant protein LEA-2 subgroup domain-containing protein n=1 Tax=Veronia pacifica TaxID=1080227 RepID=A0A1C3EPT6_9GAMM|nr:LEA type 2 family protein [Veronia pacifica]ODA35199.1 hypothetical protein A8L45_04610 [Veronia pacifica]